MSSVILGLAMLIVIPILAMLVFGIGFYLAIYGLKVKIGAMITAYRTPVKIENPDRATPILCTFDHESDDTI